MNTSFDAGRDLINIINVLHRLFDRPREVPRAPRSAGAVPAFGKWDKGPGEAVVVGGFRQRGECRQTGQKGFLRRRLERRSQSLQQSVEFNLAHGVLEFGERSDLNVRIVIFSNSPTCHCWVTIESFNLNGCKETGQGDRLCRDCLTG